MWSFLLAFIPRAVVQGIPLLFGCTGEIVTEKSGNLNLGIPGVMYVGAISGVIGSFFYEKSVSGASMNPVLAVLIPMFCCLLGSLLMGLLYCFLTVTLRANQNVTGLAMTTFGVGFGNFFGGSSWLPVMFLPLRLPLPADTSANPFPLQGISVGSESCFCPMVFWHIWA